MKSKKTQKNNQQTKQTKNPKTNNQKYRWHWCFQFFCSGTENSQLYYTIMITTFSCRYFVISYIHYNFSVRPGTGCRTASDEQGEFQGAKYLPCQIQFHYWHWHLECHELLSETQSQWSPVSRCTPGTGFAHWLCLYPVWLFPEVFEFSHLCLNLTYNMYLSCMLSNPCRKHLVDVVGCVTDASWIIGCFRSHIIRHTRSGNPVGVDQAPKCISPATHWSLATLWLFLRFHFRIKWPSFWSLLSCSTAWELCRVCVLQSLCIRPLCTHRKSSSLCSCTPHYFPVHFLSVRWFVALDMIILSGLSYVMAKWAVQTAHSELSRTRSWITMTP